jgi:competence/damage-inducible protein CinA-like protein
MSAERAELLAIGSELLDPWRTDTNGAYLSRRLGEHGIPVRFRTVVGDRVDDIAAAFEVALRRSDLIVATGGLGPTVDDVTREALARALALPLQEDAAILSWLQERFRRLGIDMPPRNRRQAMVLQGAEVIPNRLGTAPGQLIRAGDSAVVVILPGVPSEMRHMVDEWLLPRLPSTDRYVYRILKIAGLNESEVDRRLTPVCDTAGAVDWTILAAPGQVEIHLRERVPAGGTAAGVERLERDIGAVLGTHLFGRDEATMEEIVGRLLAERRDTVAVAESLTGGSIARALTEIPGASSYFRGGVVCYSDDAKVLCCGVPATLLQRHGAVSEAVARAMAEGVRSSLASTWGLAATGYAGPEGGPGGPPGTVHLALAGPPGTDAVRLRVPGDRGVVRLRAARGALDLLRHALIGKPA